MMKSADVPRVGNIVLIQEAQKPSMAFRVITSEPNKKQYVAKRVRRYDDHQALTLHTYYNSVEKVADRINSPPMDEKEEPVETLPPMASPVTPAPVEAPPAPAAPAPPPPPPPAAAPPPAARVAAPPPTAPIPEPTLAPAPAAIPDATPEPTPEPEVTPVPIEAAPVEPAPAAEIQATPAPEPPAESLRAPEFDQKLDESTTPTTHKAKVLVDEDDVDEASSPYEIDETSRFDPNRHMISVQPGTFRNASDFVMAGELFAGMTVSYSFKLRDDWLIRAPPAPQDALWIEFGVSYYRKANASNDIYTVAPLRAELRWEINCSPTLTVQFYGGAQYNWIMSTDNFNPASASQINTLNALDGFQPTFGTGLLFHIGPQWYIRSDIGYDRINFGLGIKW